MIVYVEALAALALFIIALLAIIFGFFLIKTGVGNQDARTVIKIAGNSVESPTAGALLVLVGLASAGGGVYVVKLTSGHGPQIVVLQQLSIQNRIQVMEGLDMKTVEQLQVK